MWRIDRRISDARGPNARLSGVLDFTEAPEAPDTLVATETGRLYVGDGAPLAARRSYRWRFRPDGQIMIAFEDGRPFHSFDAGAHSPTAVHDCPPDTYQVAYEFLSPRNWRSTWRVSGPRKDYVMVSVMTRPA